MGEYGLAGKWGADASPTQDGYFGQLENEDKALSEHDHYQRVVKRNNLVSLFFDEYNADRYIATHLYGAIRDFNVEDSFDDLAALLDESLLNLSTTFAR